MRGYQEVFARLHTSSTAKCFLWFHKIFVLLICLMKKHKYNKRKVCAKFIQGVFITVRKRYVDNILWKLFTARNTINTLQNRGPGFGKIQNYCKQNNDRTGRNNKKAEYKN